MHKRFNKNIKKLLHKRNKRNKGGNMENKKNIAQVPLIAFEATATRYERIIKRQTMAICALIVANIIIIKHPLH